MPGFVRPEAFQSVFGVSVQLQDKDAVLPAVVQAAHKGLIGKKPLRPFVLHIVRTGFQLFKRNADRGGTVPPSVIEALIDHDAVLHAAILVRIAGQFQKAEGAEHAEGAVAGTGACFIRPYLHGIDILAAAAHRSSKLPSAVYGRRRAGKGFVGIRKVCRKDPLFRKFPVKLRVLLAGRGLRQPKIHGRGPPVMEGPRKMGEFADGNLAFCPEKILAHAKAFINALIDLIFRQQDPPEPFLRFLSDLKFRIRKYLQHPRQRIDRHGLIGSHIASVVKNGAVLLAAASDARRIAQTVIFQIKQEMPHIRHFFPAVLHQQDADEQGGKLHSDHIRVLEPVSRRPVFGGHVIDPAEFIGPFDVIHGLLQDSPLLQICLHEEQTAGRAPPVIPVDDRILILQMKEGETEPLLQLFFPRPHTFPGQSLQHAHIKGAVLDMYAGDLPLLLLQHIAVPEGKKRFP